jgi:hypothetical protein
METYVPPVASVAGSRPQQCGLCAVGRATDTTIQKPTGSVLTITHSHTLRAKFNKAAGREKIRVP